MSKIEVDAIEPQSGTTLTIGASGDTITIPSGATLTNSGTATGFGIVLQVVNAKFGTLTTSSSSTFADTGLTASITPSSASNKILVFANMVGCAKSANNTYMGLRLLRNSTTIHLLETQAGYTAGGVTANWGSDSVTYLDNPATTSATTYKVQFNNGAATGTVLVNDGSSLDGCTITLMEISA